MIEDRISYERIGKAQLFYKALGYFNVDTPWMVSPQAIRATLPPTHISIDSVFGSLVGSGEQGFIQQMMSGELTPGKYQTTTPCFRDEKEYNDLTRKYFMKVELIWYMPEDVKTCYETVMNNALSCFFSISDQDTFEAMQTSEGFDIMLNGIEIGSYGVRQMGDHLWVFGTGLAEPRFSLALASTRSPSVASVQASQSMETPAIAPTLQETGQTTPLLQEDTHQRPKVIEFPNKA